MSEANDIIKSSDALLAELRGTIAEARGQVAQVTNAAFQDHLNIVVFTNRPLVGNRTHHPSHSPLRSK